MCDFIFYALKIYYCKKNVNHFKTILNITLNNYKKLTILSYIKIYDWMPVYIVNTL